jgi:hypothetical protein
MAGMMHFLAEGATFALGMGLQLQRFSPPLAPPAPTETSETRVSGITHALAAEAIARGTVPLLSFANFNSRMSVPDGHFKPAMVHDPESLAVIAPFFSTTFGRLPETFTAASAFPFFRTSGETGTERGP